jgi:DNA-binding response OmpR family regulator
MITELVALVIEDDYDASVIFAKALEVLGFKTEVIDSGEKALKRLKEVVPVIVLLDLHLPEVLGTNIIRTIRADERLGETLVIIASADPRSADLVQDLADLVLIKPTTFSQVRDLAGRLTAPRRKKYAAELAATQTATQEITYEVKREIPLAAPATEPVTPKEETPAAPVVAASQAKTEEIPQPAQEQVVAEPEKPAASDPPADSGSGQA